MTSMLCMVILVCGLANYAKIIQNHKVNVYLLAMHGQPIPAYHGVSEKRQLHIFQCVVEHA